MFFFSPRGIDLFLTSKPVYTGRHTTMDHAESIYHPVRACYLSPVAESKARRSVKNGAHTVSIIARTRCMCRFDLCAELPQRAALPTFLGYDILLFHIQNGRMHTKFDFKHLIRFLHDLRFVCAGKCRDDYL